MTGLDFFVDVVVRGMVLGVGAGDPPDEVARVLGSGYVEDLRRTTLRRDYGLVEFSWTRGRDDTAWCPGGFVVQVHRLTALPVTTPFDRYGSFDQRLRFDGLARTVAALDQRLEEIAREGDSPTFRRYGLAESQTVILVVADSADGRLSAGDVWSIAVPSPAAGRPAARSQAIDHQLAHMLRLSDTARADWLQRNQPAAAHVNWWLALLCTPDRKFNKAGRPIQMRADWVRLTLWLLRWTSDQGVFNAYEHAQRMAYFRAMLKDLDIDSLALAPSADEIVRNCLAAIPVSLDEVALVDHPSALRRLNRSQMWASRRAKNLINAAEYNLDDVTDERLAQQLRQWIAVKRRLV
ncbi:hypothetical protein [Plantactinospora sp. KBS50]|uniref:hypothetical protein n=1 Tax=Plantactinospora sp. KBS50 TaxID=2024580 RepID=UPI000BAABA98|nr:hypothetical protein [Plantactinospora sp. KBS50]ASW57211.1 hypothetical protein CIK06_28335 [Plantactinospora sp. KBS50]